MSQARILSQSEFRKILLHIAKNKHHARNKAILYCSFFGCMRVGEIASLTLGDVRNKDSSIRAEVRLTAEQTKGRQPRTVFVPQKLQNELAAYLSPWGELPDAHPLFVTCGGCAFSANVMAQHFHYLFKRAGIAGASSHSMRRSFITNLATKGIGVRVLASLAGHRSIAVTQKYIDVNDDMMRNAVELA